MKGSVTITVTWHFTVTSCIKTWASDQRWQHDAARGGWSSKTEKQQSFYLCFSPEFWLFLLHIFQCFSEIKWMLLPGLIDFSKIDLPLVHLNQVWLPQCPSPLTVRHVWMFMSPPLILSRSAFTVSLPSLWLFHTLPASCLPAQLRPSHNNSFLTNCHQSQDAVWLIVQAETTEKLSGKEGVRGAIRHKSDSDAAGGRAASVCADT